MPYRRLGVIARAGERESRAGNTKGTLTLACLYLQPAVHAPISNRHVNP